MKSNKGVTLASLTIYIIVLVILLVIMTFISANYTSQISDVTVRGKISNESIKLYSFMVSDLKSANTVLEYSSNYIRLDNDVKYSIEYKYISEKENQRRQYDIYRNGVLVSEDLLDASFDYDLDSNAVTVNLKYIYNKVMVEKSQSFMIGRGY